MQSNVIKSASVKIKPSDPRCRYWCKIIRAGVSLPLPADVSGANQLPGSYSRNGEDELFEGDVVIEGEEIHHRRSRGWHYTIGAMGDDGAAAYVTPTAAIKAAIKAAGLIPSQMLAGSGDIASCVRIAHALRAGMTIESIKAV